jgi:hypothetical protein
MCALFAGGCAQTSDFKAPIDAYSSATQAATTSINSYADAIDQSRSAAKLADASKNSARVLPAQGDCNANSSGCRLEYLTNGKRDPLTSSSATPTIRAINAELVAYAKNLQDLASAGDETALSASLEKVSQSAKGLIATLDKTLQENGVASNAPKDAGKFIEPAAGLGRLLVTSAIQQKKLAALRTATEAMQPHMTDIVAITELLGRAARADSVDENVRAFSAARIAYTRTPSQATLTAYIKASQNLDNVLKADPAKVAQAMADAHEALWKALQDDSFTVAILTVRLERLIAEAQEFKGIVDAFKAAAAKLAPPSS